MSAAAVKWAKSQQLPQTQKAVLVSIADHHSPRWGVSKPSQKTIAYDVGVSRETVNRAIKALEVKNYLKSDRNDRKKGQWEQCAYRLNMPPLAAKKRADRVTQDHMAPCDDNQTRHRVTEDHTSKGINVAPTGEVVFFPASNLKSQVAS